MPFKIAHSAIRQDRDKVPAAMSDFGHYGGSEEEYATVRKYNAEVVRLLPAARAHAVSPFS